MSGSNRRRVSKWDHKDTEALPESFHERSSARKTREPLSPSRASRRHESRSKESMVPWDREGSGARMSPGLDDWGDQHHSRSPRNDWRRSYRSRSRSRTRSRSRSRSRSPIHNSARRDPPLANDNRSRGGSRSAASGQQICRDFSAGRCRRGSHCQFLHSDVEPYDGGGRPLKNSSPDEWDNNNDSSRHRRNRGGSKYSPEKGPVEDVYSTRERDTEPRSRDPYSDRNRDRDPPPPNRGETPLCKFFAAGNCRNGKRCRFSHGVDGGERSMDDDNRQGAPPPDHKFDNEPPVVWDGPTWNDVGWGENKNETTEAASEMGLMNHNKNNTWDPPGVADEPKTRDRDRDKWKSENGNMEISPNPQTLLPNMSFPPPPPPAAAVQQNPTGETSYEKRYPLAPFQDQKVAVSDSNSSYPALNPTSYKDNVNAGMINQTVVSDPSYPGGLNPSSRNDAGINQKVVNDVGLPQRVVNDSSSYPGLNPSYNANEGNHPPPMMNPPPLPPPQQQQQTIFQSDPRVNLQPPIEPFPLAPTEPPSAAVAANLNNPSNPINPNPVRSEQLAQLSHLTASLAQLLESRQATSGAAAGGVVATLNGAVQPPQYDPISDSVEPKLVHKEPHHQQQEEHDNDNNKESRSKKEDENDENDGGEDGKKMKDSKGTRVFKFALVDFVKDLLKPTWKDGQVSKEVYKTIVKKVVDKVIETQGPQVPQTKEKIDQYLLYSKPKIEKLVQAYVGKYQKGKA